MNEFYVLDMFSGDDYESDESFLVYLLACFPGRREWGVEATIVKFLGAGEDDVTVAVDAFEPAFEDAGVGYGDS
jgi:hypothetical protein